MSCRNDLLDQARSQLGYKEGANNDTIFGRWYGLNHNPWCMMFISYCAHQTGLPTTVVPKMAYCPYALAWFRGRGQFLPAGAAAEPQPGDLVFFDLDGGGADHVGLAERVEDGKLYTIEGNVGNQVQRRSYLLRDKRLLGYGRPAFPDEQEEKMQISDIKIYLPDSNQDMTVQGCVEDGTTYVKLRDLERLFPVIVGWDGKRPTVSWNYRS